VYTSIAFHVGTQLDIFTVLDPRALTVEEASAATKLKPEFLERLLYALAAAEMLTVEDGRFANTKEASRYLVRGKPDFLGNHVLVDPFLRNWMFRAGTITAESLRAGRATEGFDYSATPLQDLLAAFRGTMPVAVEAGRHLAEAYDLSKHATLADVGGASGGLAVSVVKAFPHLKATVTDLPSVTPVAVALLREQGTPEIDVLEWNVLEGPCRRSFDVVVLRALIQVLSPDQARRALVNIAESVNPGGRIFILGHVMDDLRVSPPEEVIWYLLNLNWEDHAGFYAEKDYRDMLSNAGFQDVRRDRLPNGDGIMTARKPDARGDP
jgi:SAM-dependent methyltransferase